MPGSDGDAPPVRDLADLALEKERLTLVKDPYEILIVAGLFFGPGLFLLLHTGGAIVALTSSSRTGRTGALAGFQIEPESVMHGYGVALLIAALAIAAFYFHLRRELRLDARFPHRRKRRTR